MYPKQCGCSHSTVQLDITYLANNDALQDLKLENMLLSKVKDPKTGEKKLIAKLGDFGLMVVSVRSCLHDQNLDYDATRFITTAELN